MGRNHSRLGVWLLALTTCIFVAGGQAAYGFQARVHAGGQFFHGDNVSFTSDRVSFGLEGKCPAANTQCTSNGNFEYHNTFTHFHVHGKVKTLSVNSQPSAACMAIFSGPPGHPELGLGIDMTGKPSAVADGTCNDGSCSTFHIEVIDGDDNVPNNGDWVCNIMFTDSTGNLNSREDDSAEQLIRGDVEVKTTSEH